jgi:hypothetical protein
VYDERSRLSIFVLSALDGSSILKLVSVVDEVEKVGRCLWDVEVRPGDVLELSHMTFGSGRFVGIGEDEGSLDGRARGSSVGGWWSTKVEAARVVGRHDIFAAFGPKRLEGEGTVRLVAPVVATLDLPALVLLREPIWTKQHLRLAQEADGRERRKDAHDDDPNVLFPAERPEVLIRRGKRTLSSDVAFVCSSRLDVGGVDVVGAVIVGGFVESDSSCTGENRKYEHLHERRELRPDKN